MALVDTTPAVRLRPYRASDRANIEELFLQTAFDGAVRRPSRRDLAPYIGLSLDFYVDHPRTSITVVSIDEEMVAYAIYCADAADMNTWMIRRSVRVFLQVMGMLTTGRLTRIGFGFYFRRTLDSIMILWDRRRSAVDDLPHAHLNVRSGHQTGNCALMLLNDLDQRCRETGATAWLGEINGMGTSRRRAVERLLGEVIDVRRNFTHSWLMGREVNRLTVRRTVPPLRESN